MFEQSQQIGNHHLRSLLVHLHTFKDKVIRERLAFKTNPVVLGAQELRNANAVTTASPPSP